VGEQLAHEAVGVVAVEQARPPVYFPAFAPAGALIAPRFEAFAGGGQQGGVGVGRDFPAGVQAVEVRGVAVARVGFGKFLRPF
nr:hypothetical protein [Tanacetum cinerariifolium]